MIWSEARRRGLSPVQLAEWMCAGPARLAHIEWSKGKIEKGFDADFVIWDPTASAVIEPGKIEHKNKITPYAGEDLQGVVQATYLRGKKIFDRGRFYGSPEGRILKREA